MTVPRKRSPQMQAAIDAALASQPGCLTPAQQRVLLGLRLAPVAREDEQPQPEPGAA